MATCDATIMGGGIFGLAIAHAMSRRGARVHLIEATNIGAGSSGGIVGALSPHVPENWNDKKAFQLHSLLMAQDWWAEVSRLSGLPTGYARTGRLQPVGDLRAIETARARALTAAELWPQNVLWQVVPAGNAQWQPCSPTGLLIHDTLTARLHPRLAAAALVAAIKKQGGTITLGKAAPEGPVIWATGLAGLQALSADLGKEVGDGVKGQALLLDYSAPDAAQLFVDGLHIIPHADGTVAIGSTSERQWDAPDTTDNQLDILHARAVAALPLLANAPILERWAGVRPRAKSRAPMLGEWPSRPGHYIANGGFKIGFGMAPKVAEVMADLVLEGKNTIPPGFQVEASL